MNTMRRLLAAAAIATALTGLMPAAADAWGSAPGSPGGSDKRAAIVIDDLGNDMSGTKEVMEAPVRLTVAVMPFLPTSQRDAEWAHRVGHDVIVHMPMEPLRGKKHWLGPGAITTELTDGQIRERVEAAIAEVPHAIGMNNHMGSKATADERVMRIVLEVCKERGLFFLDSRTNYRSVAPQIGEKLGVQVLKNDLFLDDVSSLTHITRQFQLVRKRLIEAETCIAIGHVGLPGKKTAEALYNSAASMRQEIRFVGLSELAAPSVLP